MKAELRVGDVAVAPLPGGGFGACQVSGITGEATTLHALAWSSPEPPGLDDLRQAGPVPLTHHHSTDRFAQISVFHGSHPMPADFDWIGNLPVPDGVPAQVNAYSGWEWPLGAVARQRDWDALAAEVRTAFQTLGPPEPVTADLGAGPVSLTTADSGLDLVSGAVPVPPAGPVDWSVLDRLPRCTRITWSGPDRGLTEVLARHPLVTDLHWLDAPAVVDLRDTGVRDLRVAGDSLREVRLPSTAHHLLLGPTAARCTVLAADSGRWLRLDLYQATTSTRVPAGLDQVRSVSLSGRGTLSAATLDGLTALHTLELRWTSPPGRLDEPAVLAGLSSLRIVEMFDAYGLDSGTLPDLPSLRHLSVHGLRGSVARELRARFRRTGVELSLRGAKTDTWLAANLDNPFRDWADDNARAGAAACKAYATALRAIDRLTPAPTSPAAPSAAAPASPAAPSAAAPTSPAASPAAAASASPAAASASPTAAPTSPAASSAASASAATSSVAAALVATPDPAPSPYAGTMAAVEAILRELIDKLHAVDKKYEIIDTVRREEAADAFMTLATRAGVPADQASAWFDNWRDF